MLTAKPLDVLTHIRHGFFTREGGVSKGIYASLNCGYGSNDDKGAVSENRARIAQGLSVAPEKLLTVYQVHSPRVIHVTEPWSPADAPQADAMVTDRSNVALGILAADCAPVLFADNAARVIGAAHAGWKGAFTGVLEATIEAMTGLGAARERIVAAIGPCISRDAYEVGPEFRDRFLETDAANGKWFTPSARDTHFMFDLPAYAASRLDAAGVAAVTTLGLCTYADEKRFFSYRRTTHRGEPDYGRQMSAIALRAES
ncbi:MAG TPA: peptidoglycan editing factor PgeF [Parvibaculum sp.]